MAVAVGGGFSIRRPISINSPPIVSHDVVVTPMSISDQPIAREQGYIYLPTGTPTNDYYGGHRLGDNLFAESLVALDIETGERMWHFRAVHHGVWDYDFPTHPNLVDVTVDGREIKALAQVSKQGFAYVFDRVTGEPVWPIEERAVETDTDLPGEVLSPTQPFPTKPLPFDADPAHDRHDHRPYSARSAGPRSYPTMNRPAASS